jgi:hypothetical protein
VAAYGPQNYDGNTNDHNDDGDDDDSFVPPKRTYSHPTISPALMAAIAPPSSHYHWLVELQIFLSSSSSVSTNEIHSISTIPNLCVLAIEAATDGIGVDDRTVRAWCRTAVEYGYWRDLRIVSLRRFVDVTNLSLVYFSSVVSVGAVDLRGNTSTKKVDTGSWIMVRQEKFKITLRSLEKGFCIPVVGVYFGTRPCAIMDSVSGTGLYIRSPSSPPASTLAQEIQLQGRRNNKKLGNARSPSGNEAGNTPTTPKLHIRKRKDIGNLLEEFSSTRVMNKKRV